MEKETKNEADNQEVVELSKRVGTLESNNDIFVLQEKFEILQAGMLDNTDIDEQRIRELDSTVKSVSKEIKEFKIILDNLGNLLKILNERVLTSEERVDEAIGEIEDVSKYGDKINSIIREIKKSPFVNKGVLNKLDE